MHHPPPAGQQFIFNIGGHVTPIIYNEWVALISEPSKDIIRRDNKEITEYYRHINPNNTTTYLDIKRFIVAYISHILENIDYNGGNSLNALTNKTYINYTLDEVEFYINLNFKTNKDCLVLHVLKDLVNYDTNSSVRLGAFFEYILAIVHNYLLPEIMMHLGDHERHSSMVVKRICDYYEFMLIEIY